MGFEKTPEEKKAYDDFIDKIDKALESKPKYIIIHWRDLCKWTVRKFNCYPDDTSHIHKVGDTTFINPNGTLKQGEIEVIQ